MLRRNDERLPLVEWYHTLHPDCILVPNSVDNTAVQGWKKDSYCKAVWSGPSLTEFNETCELVSYTLVLIKHIFKPGVGETAIAVSLPCLLLHGAKSALGVYWATCIRGTRRSNVYLMTAHFVIIQYLTGIERACIFKTHFLQGYRNAYKSVWRQN